MTFEEFVQLAGPSVTMNFDRPDWYRSWRDKRVRDVPYLTAEWTSGGTGGGSCWDEDHHYSISGEPEAELTSLDELLEKVKPDIGFLQYKELCNEVVHYGEYSQAEYYGNSTEFGVKYVKLSELYDYIKTKGWIS